MIYYYIKEQELKQFGDGEKKKKYFASIDEKLMLDTDEMCQRVADRSTLAKAEMRLAMDMFCEMARVALMEGRSVRIGDLGVIHPVVNAKVCPKKEDVTVQTIKKISCSLRISDKLKKDLNTTHLRKTVRPNSD